MKCRFLADCTNSRTIGTVLHPSFVTWRIVAKWCVLEQKLPLTAYRKSYMSSTSARESVDHHWSINDWCRLTRQLLEYRE